MDDHPSNGDPFPRYRLNFDEDTPSSSSERNRVLHTPNENTTPMSRLSKSEGKGRRADSRVSVSEASKRMAGSGDWSPTSSRRIYDSDDDSLERSPKSRMTMSCPPYHQPLRLRCRNRPIPRLDFSRVDEFPEAFSSPATTTDSTVSSLSSNNRTRSRSKVKHSRMVS
ncbi:hypothetical protein TELCIR_21899 [Teladorsagia circumcincta]|uniref:Uncharacterized protein n=1 Tax=Teladorsagia circumcincta TaxID=45464 RepID=A0A2G9TH76_TELCI|nr:hypothetical protein TELCIR_21899 [Teladorsagia circumcincta]